MSYAIVVARYNENIDWLLPDISNCIIYNKGVKLPYSVNEIMLNNVGRESETYLQYIITHYDDLPDIVIFTQARISDHTDSDPLKYIYKLRDEAKIYEKSKSRICQYNNTTSPNWCLYLQPEWNTDGNGHFYLIDNYYLNKPIVFKKWFEISVQNDYPDPIHIYINGLFAVKKELILRRPLVYYKWLIQFVNHHVNPAEGHFFERSWYYIFT